MGKLTDALMIGATTLSALATGFTGYIAVKQYGAMREALTADSRNTAFEKVLTALDAACAARPPVKVDWLSERLSNGQVYSEYAYDQFAATYRGKLTSARTELSKSFDAFRIWLIDDGDERFIQEASWYFGGEFARIDEINNSYKDAARQELIRQWSLGVLGAEVACDFRKRSLIKWFRTRDRFDIKPIENSPDWRAEFLLLPK